MPWVYFILEPSTLGRGCAPVAPLFAPNRGTHGGIASTKRGNHGGIAPTEIGKPVTVKWGALHCGATQTLTWLKRLVVRTLVRTRAKVKCTRAMDPVQL